DRRANPSFKRRASIVQTATPKVLEAKGKKPGQATPAIKQRDHREAISNGHAQDKDSDAGCTSPSSSRASREGGQEDGQKENGELTMLREQLDALHNILAEKDEALKSAEESVDKMRTTYATSDELKRRNLEKDSLLSSTNSQLSNAKIQLAERQEALEKLENEARISNRKVQELQADMDSMGFEKFALTLLFQELSKNDPATDFDENISSFKQFGHLPPIDNMSETELKQMEEARVAYIAAVAVAQENPTVESLAAAAEARLKLEAFVF
ncbi:uncharacterized protein A4U43_C05F14230, partial [Asparagus officinalis]